jgi:hypothetical protein
MCELRHIAAKVGLQLAWHADVGPGNPVKRVERGSRPIQNGASDAPIHNSGFAGEHHRDSGGLHC